MIGRYISEENYYKLGLDQNEGFNKCASKTLLVILEDDVDNTRERFSFTLEQRTSFATDVCECSSRLLDRIVDCAAQYATCLSEESDE